MPSLVKQKDEEVVHLVHHKNVEKGMTSSAHQVCRLIYLLISDKIATLFIFFMILINLLTFDGMSLSRKVLTVGSGFALSLVQVGLLQITACHIFTCFAILFKENHNSFEDM